ncbi:MAG: hypothetical protein EZS28_015702 [Streblomastix strix]|uniref:Reverse transcriptase domain-containing protein n=1 Tax=Streblomastix strix TaxID=222440 RepID=A0A5J4W1F0_9EUKA|nr:MAG: hypothetical protein EZS28_015702 [Streblomastix strix]
MKEFFLIFTNNRSESRLATTLRPLPFKESPKTNKAYSEILQTELEEGIIEVTPGELVKCWNPNFIVPKPDGGSRKILDASQLNDEILPLHFQMQGVENVKIKIKPMDQMIKLDLKLEFHHLTVYELHRPYITFEVEGVCYMYKGMAFGTQHSPTFFTEAMNRILAEVRKTCYLRIIYSSDNIVLLNQDQMMQIQRTIRYLRYSN